MPRTKSTALVPAGPKQIRALVENSKQVPQKSESSLATVLRKIGGNKGAMDICRLAASSDPQLAEMVSYYDTLPGKEKSKIAMEELCKCVQLSPGEFLGKLARYAWDIGRPMANLMLALKAPEIHEKAMEIAMQDDGFKDREKLLIQAGLYPKRDPLVRVSQTNTQAVQVQGGLPFRTVEETAQDLEDIFVDGELIQEGVQEGVQGD